LALVAVAVDAPLTKHDISLLERLFDLTPNVSVLLTKMDTLDEASQQEVLHFVKTQLEKRFPGSVPVFPYSIKPGYEHWRGQLERDYILKASATLQKQRESVFTRKLQTLLRATEDYLQFALKSAERLAADREELCAQVLGSGQALADQKLQLRLLARHAASRVRPAIEKHLENRALRQLQKKLSARLSEVLPCWRGSFAKILSQFEQWLRAELEAELAALSDRERNVFQEPLQNVERQLERHLQTFRGQLSEKVERVFGIPLRTAETEIEIQPPRFPDISVGRVFDHNWELISVLIPMPLVRRGMERRFRERAETEVYKNLSRLTSQWEDAISAAIQNAEKEAERRFEELVSTVEHLLLAEGPTAETGIQSYIQRLREASNGIRASPA